MTKIWYIDIEKLTHSLAFQMYEEASEEYILSSTTEEVNHHFTQFREQIEVIVVQASFTVTRSFMSQLPKLKGICTIGMGFNNVDIDAAKELGITVSNVPDYSTMEVADHTVTLALAALRDIKRFDQDVSQLKWIPTMKTPIRRFNQLTYGLIGFGKIAQEVSKRLKAFGFKLVAYDKYAPSEVFEEFGVESVSLEELISNANVISVHVPLTPETMHLIDEDLIDKMPNDVVIVNTSRGGVIDEEALAKAINNKKVLRAALDVVKNEPMQNDHPLLNKEEVIITPHVAYLSIEAEKELQFKTANNVLKIINGEQPNYIVNK